MIFVQSDLQIKDVTNVVNDKTPSVSGIVSQECKGRLWVDNVILPRIAVVESFATGSFAFVGTYNTEDDFLYLKNFLDKELFCLLKEQGYDYFEFSIDSETLKMKVLEMFKDKSIQTEKEFSFRAYEVPKNRQITPTEYQIKKVDYEFRELLLEGQYENEEFIKTRLLESWHSFNEFMNHSIAYCVVLHNRIVAVMVGTACYQKVIAIDIETEEIHRRKGLAYAMAVEFINDCLNNGYIPQWDCVESNPNSYILATKLGFEKINENIVYWFKL